MRIWSHLVKKFLMENFIFGLVKCTLFLFPLFISFFLTKSIIRNVSWQKLSNFLSAVFEKFIAKRLIILYVELVS